MIKFSCNNCGRKIGVKDELAGKRGKCPECSGIIVVPEKTILINFNCENCGEKISAPGTRAGKEGKCPKCKHELVIPAAHNLTLLDVGEEYRNQDQPTIPASAFQNVTEQEREEESQAEEGESAAERNLPWLVDIFLYPTSTAGLTHMGIFTILPLLVVIFDAMRHPFRMGLGRGFGIVGIVATAAFFLYLCWYLTECVRDSAKGGTRAPEAFATASLGEMWSQAQHIIGCYLIFVGPVGFYYLFTGRTDAVFWLLLAYGVFFLPIGLLACIMFDSIRGLNPVLLIASIFSTIVQYCGLVLIIWVLILIFRVTTTMETGQAQRASVTGLILGAVFYLLFLYGAFTVSHLLGRFYWRNQEKLNWEV